MEHIPLIVFIIAAVALIFDFTNGFNDSGNIVATMITARVLSPRAALFIAAAAEFIGPFLFGTAVAAAIAGILKHGSMTVWVILSALLGAIAWNLITWYFGIPSSSSHALVGGFVGAGVVSAGWASVNVCGLTKVVIALIISPVLGIIFGFLFMKIVQAITQRATPHISKVFKGLTVISALALALSHGANDAQKSMGVITIALVTLGILPSFAVPPWVIFACAFAISAGIATGGWRIIKTVGRGIYKIRLVHSFCAQAVSAAIILGGALVGGPVSTTHVLSSAIMGVGAAERVSAVKWHMAKHIVTTWILTIPAAGIISAGIYWVMYFIIGSGFKVVIR